MVITIYIQYIYPVSMKILDYRRKYGPLFHFFYIFYISSSWVLILYKRIENWCYKEIKLTPWRWVLFDFVPNFQCWWRDFERTGVKRPKYMLDIRNLLQYILFYINLVVFFFNFMKLDNKLHYFSMTLFLNIFLKRNAKYSSNIHGRMKDRQKLDKQLYAYKHL